MTTYDNPMGTDGFEFLEFSAAKPQKLIDSWHALGFRLAGKHKTKEIYHYRQGDVNFLLNQQAGDFAEQFTNTHGDCVSAMGFRVKDAKFAYQRALELGAKPYQGAEGEQGLAQLAIYGIGDNLLYFVDRYGEQTIYQDQFIAQADPTYPNNNAGIVYLDHVTHNVFTGRLDYWAGYYETFFNFREIRYFDIRGKVTGLISRAMTSPCGKIRIPLNEATEEASQIAEYLREYNGEGIQHIALAVDNIYHSVEGMRERGIQFLDTPATYYELIDARVTGHQEDIPRLQKNRILIDGKGDSDEGILLQIFTENLIGPVFYEIIQRKGNQGFGEGNFTALFKAMELDQINRGVLKVD